MTAFANIIDDFQTLSTEEMEDAQSLMKKILIERKREQWAKQIEENKILHKEGKLFKPESMDALVKWLAADD